MTIQTALLQMIEDEGKQTALDEAQRLQLSLETLCEIGDPEERKAAMLLLKRVETAMTTMIASPYGWTHV